MKQVLGRLLQTLVTLVGVSFLTFCLAHLAPGDPAMTLLEASDTIVSAETIEKTRQELGIDRPFLVQYVSWAGGALTGDLGMSYSAKKPVTEKLLEGFFGTISLAAVAIIFMLAISLPLGVWSATHRNCVPDYLVRAFSFVGVSMPSFWIGLLLLYVFGLKLGLFPIASSSVTAKGIVLPALTLAIYMASKYVRQVRTIVLEELHQDYVTGARARGLSDRRILWRHVMPNAVLPLVTLLGMSIGWLLGGVAVIEIVFSWPGIGNTAVRAIMMRDYPLIEGFVLWVAVIYTGINLLVDLSYAYFDPRLGKEGER